MSSLKYHKEDVAQANLGSDCGVSFASYDDVMVGDIVECYEIKQEPPTLTSNQ